MYCNQWFGSEKEENTVIITVMVNMASSMVMVSAMVTVMDMENIFMTRSHKFNQNIAVNKL